MYLYNTWFLLTFLKKLLIAGASELLFVDIFQTVHYMYVNDHSQPDPLTLHRKKLPQPVPQFFSNIFLSLDLRMTLLIVQK